ncbi:hypothetical protein BGU93_19200, partial [Clostridioides difficile]
MDEIKAELWEGINQPPDQLRGAPTSPTNLVKAAWMPKYHNEAVYTLPDLHPDTATRPARRR